MRRLMLLRHAKAEAPAGSVSDLKRALTSEGRAAAARVGAHMTQHGLQPERVLLSPARRTQETWEALKLTGAPRLQNAPELYDATPERILATLRALRGDAAAVLVVAHNPGLHELANKLMDEGDVAGRSRLGGFPPAGLAVLDFDVPSWRDVVPGTGVLAVYLDPRRLGAEAG